MSEVTIVTVTGYTLHLSPEEAQAVVNVLHARTRPNEVRQDNPAVYGVMEELSAAGLEVQS